MFLRKAWLPWFDGLLKANEEYYEKYGEPLFSSHMLDLSEETLEENIAICKKYLERMSKVVDKRPPRHKQSK